MAQITTQPRQSHIITPQTTHSPITFWPEMTALLAEQYTRAANANDALVIPAGLAFAKAIAKRPDVELYVADKRHPCLAGTCLAASTVYATLYRKSSVGLSYTAGLSPELATLLQTAAWATVQEYFKASTSN